MATDRLAHTARRVILIQLALVVLAAVIFSLEKGTNFALALLFGGGVTIAGTLLSAWRLKVATQAVENSAPAVNAVELYKAMFFKLALFIGLFALGLGVLKLAPLAVIMGFIVAQAGYLFSRGYAPRAPRQRRD